MCKPASFVVGKGHVFHWLSSSDSHAEIIRKKGLLEEDITGRLNVMPVEVSPDDGDLSRPLNEWTYREDLAGVDRERPEWYDFETAKERSSSALKAWADRKLSGWRVQEVFHPVNPLKVKRNKDLTEDELLELLTAWDSIRDSIRNSIGNSVGYSIGYSIWDSVRNSVRNLAGGSAWPSDSIRDSVWDSVWGYMGSLFPNITDWIGTSDPHPWASIRELWINGYVPYPNGETWRVLDCTNNHKIVLEKEL